MSIFENPALDLKFSYIIIILPCSFFSYWDFFFLLYILGNYTTTSLRAAALCWVCALRYYEFVNRYHYDAAFVILNIHIYYHKIWILCWYGEYGRLICVLLISIYTHVSGIWTRDTITVCSDCYRISIRWETLFWTTYIILHIVPLMSLKRSSLVLEPEV